MSKIPITTEVMIYDKKSIKPQSTINEYVDISILTVVVETARTKNEIFAAPIVIPQRPRNVTYSLITVIAATIPRFSVTRVSALAPDGQKGVPKIAQ